MRIPLGLTCATCKQALYPHLTRRTNDGLVHSQCPNTCTDCASPIGAKCQTGLCRRCYDRRRRAAQRIEVTAIKSTPRPCTRCGVKTGVGICRDCRDVLSAEEIGRWVA